ncbi:MAG TPA: PRC-barrel domain-containing protein [Verrucomicrobiae bacterium]|jgi:sporulation protein YlmC with PRC-barrel domain|nr:PRC-barrel domain-containing protein [Verrucomicrobiae bacterium]
MSVSRPLAISGLIAILATASAPTLLADQPALEPPSTKCLAVMQRFTQIAGLPVKTRQDRTIGKIDDLLIDLHSGTVLCAVITPIGNGDDVLVAVPAQSFTSTDQHRAVVNAAKETVQSAPHLASGRADDATIAKTISDAYEHFHQPAVWNASAAPAVVRASKLIGCSVRNNAHEDLGNVKDFMVDLLTARVVFSVLSLDGSDLNRYATPPSALVVNPGKTFLVLNATKAQITETAHKGGDLANQMADPPWAAATYRLYDAGTAPASADPTHENVRARIDAPANANTGASASPAPAAAPPPALPDEEIKKRILTAIIRDDLGNAYSYKQLKIVTENGHVILQGRTKNAKQKAELGKLAESVVGPGNVDNQLEVRK